MLFRDIPIQKKLMRIMFLISGVVLLVTCLTFFIYEFYAFRKTTEEKLSTIGKIIAANSTAALAFDDPDAAKEILTALRTEPHIVAASLYDRNGKLFAQYPLGLAANVFPAKPETQGYHFANFNLEGFQPVVQDSRQLGTLYLKSDLGAMYDRFRLYGVIVVLIITVSFLLAYLLSKTLQKSISKPILALSETASRISDKGDYSLRAVKTGKDELGLLTDTFNHMLVRIQEQNLALNEFSQNLEQKVIERTIELETVNKELEAFTYSVSHDLRSPLRIIHGYGSVLTDDYGAQMGEDGTRILSNIMLNAQRMGQLIDALLHLSRLGRKDLELYPVDMNSLVKSILNEQSTVNNFIKSEIIIHDPEPAYCDSSLIKQVWINLLSNAVKYSANQDSPVIEVGSEKSKTEIIYYVKDNGVGFDMQYANKLFGVFQRLHKITEFEGTGIGLAIVQRIVTKHKGRVWAEAELNKGATFYFSLPLEIMI